MFDKATNSKKQGDVGLGVAISYFTSQGYVVCIPLTDSQDYDLVIDDGEIKRVQVKTTSQLKENGGYQVGLRVLGGNRSWNKVAKFFDNTKVELLFVLTEDGQTFCIPTNVISAKSMIVVGNEKYSKYKVTAL